MAASDCHAASDTPRAVEIRGLQTVMIKGLFTGYEAKYLTSWNDRRIREFCAIFPIPPDNSSEPAGLKTGPEDRKTEVYQ